MSNMRDQLSEKWFFHYTNAQGLQGILTDKAFWGTDANYLNDYKEIQLGIDYARYWFDKNKEQITSKYGKKTSNSLDINMNPQPGQQSGQRMFVCSFSTEKDSLSQWRAYCSGSGYAIGIHEEYLKQKANQLGLTLQECIYDHDFENNPVASYLDGRHTSNYFENLDQDQNKLSRICIDIMRHSIILKGKAFEQEKEWRLFPNYDFGTKHKSPQEFRIRNDVFVPYMNFKLFPSTEEEKYIQISSDSSCPALRLVIGPTPHKDLARDGLSKLLWDQQEVYRFLSPEHSSATYRDW